MSSTDRPKCEMYFKLHFKKNGDFSEDPFMLELFGVMSEDRSRLWNSVELHQEYFKLGGNCVKSRAHVIEQITLHFGDSVVVLDSPGISKIVCFRNETAKLLHIAKRDDCDDDSLDIAIKKVAKAIRSETLFNKKKRNSYTININRDVV